jgi:choice-of-anchor A domain-containing protein
MSGKYIFAATAGMIASFSVSAASAATVFDYNLFVIGDFNGYNSDVEGRVAVKGNATVNGYAVGQKASAGDNLVVGGNLTVGTSGGSTSGKVVVGGTVTTPSWGGYSSGGISSGVTTLPVDFAAEITRLTWLTSELKTYSTNGTIEQKWGQMFFTGTDPVLNVFNVTAAQMASSNTFHINVASGSQVLFNVSGASASMQNAGFDLQGVDSSKILYNFYEATALSFSSIGVLGSVLATNAAYNGSWGNVNGQMIVSSFNAPTQINSSPYSGTLLSLSQPVALPADPVSGGNDNAGTPPIGPVPEISTWAQMILGFGALGWILRRSRKPARRGLI